MIIRLSSGHICCSRSWVWVNRHVEIFLSALWHGPTRSSITIDTPGIWHSIRFLLGPGILFWEGVDFLFYCLKLKFFPMTFSSSSRLTSLLPLLICFISFGWILCPEHCSLHTLYFTKVVGIGQSRCLLLKSQNIIQWWSLACNIPLWNVELETHVDSFFILLQLGSFNLHRFAAQLFDQSLFFATLPSSPFYVHALEF